MRVRDEKGFGAPVYAGAFLCLPHQLPPTSTDAKPAAGQQLCNAAVHAAKMLTSGAHLRYIRSDCTLKTATDWI